MRCMTFKRKFNKNVNLLIGRVCKNKIRNFVQAVWRYTCGLPLTTDVHVY